MPKMPKELKGIIPPQRINKKKRKLKLTDKEKDALQEKFMIEYRKEGMSINKAVKIVGFTRQHVYKWTESDAGFAAEFEELRFIKKGKKKADWDKKHEHDEEQKKQFLEIYANPEHSIVSALAEIAKDLTSKSIGYWQKTDFGFKKEYKSLQHLTRPRLAERIEIHSAVAATKLQEKQKKFLEEFRANRFNVTNTCDAMGMKRAVVSDWYKKNPDFRAEIEALQDEKEDWVEDKLFDLIDGGNMPATIYASKIHLQKTNDFRRHAHIEQPQKIEGRMEHVHKLDQAQLDAIVRGQQVDRGKYDKILGLDDPNTMDAEYETIK